MTRPGIDAAAVAPAPQALPLWPLPLLAGLLPAAAALLALWLSMQQGLVPACNPFVEGCVSVSRAARHGLPNTLFRALVLPAAALQALSWLLLARWLAIAGGRAARLRALGALGFVAAVALVLYGAFLGTEGEIYRALRRYGTVVYFGFTALCMLIAGAELQRVPAAGAVARALPLLLTLLVLLGLANALAAPWLDEALRDRVQNVTEWWAALILSAIFVLLARACRGARLALTVTAG